jgi:hypothetical protein
MNAAENLAILGFALGLVLAIGIAVETERDEGGKLAKGARFLIIVWALVFGPFVLRFWIGALLS